MKMAILDFEIKGEPGQIVLERNEGGAWRLHVDIAWPKVRASLWRPTPHAALRQLRASISFDYDYRQVLAVMNEVEARLDALALVTPKAKKKHPKRPV